MKELYARLMSHYENFPREARRAIFLTWLATWWAIGSIISGFIHEDPYTKYQAEAKTSILEFPASEETQIMWQEFVNNPHDETIENSIYKALYKYHERNCDGCDRIEDKNK